MAFVLVLVLVYIEVLNQLMLVDFWLLMGGYVVHKTQDVHIPSYCEGFG